MKLARRDFLALGAATAATAVAPAEARPAESLTGPCKAMLYDATRCIGCRGCVEACQQMNGDSVPPDRSGLYEETNGLTCENFTTIRTYRDDTTGEWSFIKRNCMHCLEPACASACLVKALEKTPEGPVVYHENKCIGCRYCMIACPFDVPTFEYDEAVPSIRKCDFCSEHTCNGGSPRCIEACPAGALEFGDRDELLEEARARVYGEPDRYVQHIYGEHEAGGTAALYIAGVSFDKLGLPTNLPTKGLPEFTKGFLNSVPLVILLWAGFCTGLRWFVERREETTEIESTAASTNGGEP